MTELLRAVSRRQLVGLAINDVVGSGVFLLPAATALLLGPNSVFVILLAGGAVALLVLCFAAAASYFDEPGGAYVYTREAFGAFVGFEVGFMTWLARIASIASLANGFALAVAFFWPVAGSGAPRALIIVALLGLFCLINVVGVRHGARTAVVLVIAKLLPLALFIGAGIFFVEWSRVAPGEMPELRAIGETGLLMLFAYAGFENTGAAAGEYKNPRRDVPFALVTMIVAVTLLYTAVQLVVLGTLPDAAASESPVAEAAGIFLGPAGAVLMSVAALLSIGGNLGNTVLIGPRYLYALAKDGYGPPILSLTCTPAFARPMPRSSFSCCSPWSWRADGLVRPAHPCHAVGRRAPRDLHRHGGGRAGAPGEARGPGRGARAAGRPRYPLARARAVVRVSGERRAVDSPSRSNPRESSGRNARPSSVSTRPRARRWKSLMSR